MIDTEVNKIGETFITFLIEPRMVIKNGRVCGTKGNQ